MTTTEALQLLDLSAPISREGVDRAFKELSLVWHPDQFAGNAALQAKAAAKSDALYAAYLWLHGLPEVGFPFRLEEEGGAAVPAAQRPPPRVPRRPQEPTQAATTATTATATAAWEPEPEPEFEPDPVPESPAGRLARKPLTLPPLPPDQVRTRGTGLAGSGEMEDVPAPFMRRAGACMIDGGILLCVLFVVLLVREYRAGVALVAAPAAFTSTLFQVGLGVGVVLYFVLLEWSPLKGSLGKRLLGLVVVDAQGGRPGLGRVALRVLGMLVSFLFPPVFCACWWTKNRQCLHDLLAGCQVAWRLPAGSEALVAAEERKQLSLGQVGSLVGALVGAAVVRYARTPQQASPWVNPSPAPYVSPEVKKLLSEPMIKLPPGMTPQPAPPAQVVPVVAPPPAAAAPAKAPELPLAELRALALQGDAVAQRELGDRFSEGNGGAVKDPTEAAVWLRKAAEQGDAKAQRGLGLSYLTGAGVATDGALAVQWLQKAVAQGDAQAMHALGGAYLLGIGVPKDLALCRQWMRRAADLGVVVAQCDLAATYLQSDSGPQDQEEGVRWLRKAVAQGLAAAEYELGVCYYNGDGGLPQSTTEAVLWYRLAAEQGHAYAEISLARHLAAGDGVAKDVVAAMQWMLLAAAQGETAVEEDIALLKPKLTAEQLAEAQRRADEFRPGPQRPPEMAAAPAPATAAAPAPAPAPPPAPALEHLPTDQRLSSGAVLVDTLQNQPGKGTLNLDNGLTADAFVKLISAGKLVAAFYVRGGQKFAFDHIPDGTYQVLYCTGFDWDAGRRDFARGRRATRYESSLNYHTETKTEGGSSVTYVDILSLTLHKIPNGNAASTDIPQEEFDRY